MKIIEIELKEETIDFYDNFAKILGKSKEEIIKQIISENKEIISENIKSIF